MNPQSAYSDSKRDSAAEAVSRHADLVRRIAHHLAARLPPSVEVDDLIQAGMLGLIEAVKQFDPSAGASFETYASIRIRGSMIDEIRRGDWVPRSVHRKVREAAEATRQLEQAHGRAASPGEVARQLGIPIDEYMKLMEGAARGQVLSLEDNLADNGELRVAGDTAAPQQDLESAEFRTALTEAISGLPERERLILSLYYEQELNLREIGAVLGVTESRVCQVHGQAMVRLRARLTEWRHDDAA
jgi:RNA polymerase sigma factor FliA